MLHDKDIAKIQEIKIFFKDTWVSPEFFKEYLDLFKISKASKIFKSVKETGVPFGDIINLLLILSSLELMRNFSYIKRMLMNSKIIR